jgi:predicted DNA-binding protein YlxM (UPF0122 family)
MEKDFKLIELFELYQGLLTARQREIFSSYYLYDLSLSEIAEPEGKTRQNVYEQVKAVKAKLHEYEKTLRLKEKADGVKTALENAGQTGTPLADKIMEILGR